MLFTVRLLLEDKGFMELKQACPPFGFDVTRKPSNRAVRTSVYELERNLSREAFEEPLSDDVQILDPSRFNQTV